MPVKQFEVKAKENSVSGGTPLDTGITVSVGDRLTITAAENDTWCCGTSDMTSNANGLIAGNKFGGVYGMMASPSAPKYSFPYGSLVATVDGGKTFFPVGTKFDSPYWRAGKLAFVYWDANGEDNTGSVTVSVEVVPGPVSVHVDPNTNSSVDGVPLKTGVMVNKGDVLKISVPVDQYWSNSPQLAGACNADGKPAEPKELKGHSFPLASLVGSLDDGKTFFLVGTKFEKTVTASGALTLFFWDTDSGNNSGFVTARITKIKAG
jgi:hypothetical protein